MSEIEKMYENVGIKPYIYCSNPRLDCDARETGNCKKDCEYYSGEKLLTPFTAEKQLELIKWLTYYDEVCRMEKIKEGWFVEIDMITSELSPTFEEALANLINKIWRDLTPEEKQQVKGILE